jgi:AraC family transcriptional regulator
LGSLIERIDLASRSRKPLAPRGSRVVCSGDRWGGIRVQQVHSPAAEWPEYYVPHHVISALVGDGCLAETWYPGIRPKTLRLPPNTVFVLPARMPVKHVNFGPTQGVQVEILPEMLDAARGQSEKRLELRRVLGVRDPVMFQLLTALRDELRVENPAGRQYAESLGSAIVAHLSYKYNSSRCRLETHRGGLSPYGLKLVMEYVHANLGVDFGILELANLVQLNVDCFIRAFRESVGVPPHRYVVMRRIEHARALLRDRSLSIPEIAGGSGFGSQSSFTRAFRREMGLSPREYRMSMWSFCSRQNDASTR